MISEKAFYNNARRSGPGVLNHQVRKNLSAEELRKYEFKGMIDKLSGQNRRVVSKNGKIQNYQNAQAKYLQAAYNHGYNFQYVKKTKLQKPVISQIPNNILASMGLSSTLLNRRKSHVQLVKSKIEKMKNIKQLNKTHLRFLKDLLLKKKKSKLTFNSIVLPKGASSEDAWYYYGWDENIPLLSYKYSKYYLRYTSNMRHEFDFNVHIHTKDANLKTVLEKYWMLGYYPMVDYYLNYPNEYYGGYGYYVNSNGEEVEMENKFKTVVKPENRHKLIIDKTARKMLKQHIISFADIIYTYFKTNHKKKYVMTFFEEEKGSAIQEFITVIDALLKY